MCAEKRISSDFKPNNHALVSAKYLQQDHMEGWVDACVWVRVGEEPLCVLRDAWSMPWPMSGYVTAEAD